MKKFLLVLLAIIVMLPSFAQEKTKETRTEKNSIKVNTLALFLATGSVFYERKISDLTSVQLGVGYLGWKYKDTKFSGLMLTPEFRIFPKKAAIDGMYVAPYGRYSNYSLTAGTAKGSLTQIGGGLLIGREWITKSGFTMDLFFGGHYTGSTVKATVGTVDEFNSSLFSGFGVRIGFALGFAF